MNINDFKKEIFSAFHIYKVSPEISDHEWLEYSKKLALLRPKNKAEAYRILHSCFPHHKFSVMAFDSVDNTDINALLLVAIKLNK
jgi:hypothetical protein